MSTKNRRKPIWDAKVDKLFKTKTAGGQSGTPKLTNCSKKNAGGQYRTPKLTNSRKHMFLSCCFDLRSVRAEPTASTGRIDPNRPPLSPVRAKATQICGRFGPSRPHQWYGSGPADPDLRSVRAEPTTAVGLDGLNRPHRWSVRARTTNRCGRFGPNRPQIRIGSARSDPQCWSARAEPKNSEARLGPSRSTELVRPPLPGERSGHTAAVEAPNH